MTKKSFKDFYNQALRYQAEGSAKDITKLIMQAKKEGLPNDELSILGSLAEGAFQFNQSHGPS